MEQPITLKRNGQINVVLKDEAQKHAKLVRTIPNEVKKEKKRVQHEALEKLEEEMCTLVGMEEMKKTVKEIYAWIYINQRRQEQGLKPGRQMLHMMFKGNPGTGKTTVARLLGKLFRDMNVLSKGHLIEAERADLVGEYIGHTAQKTRDLIKKAMGGILFIDEAYSLARGGEKDFGKEAIDTLVNHMETHRENFILILAGYSKEMDNFLSLNPGLKSRFPLMINFPNYNVDQLMKIARGMIDEREYVLSKEAERKLRNHLLDASRQDIDTFSNGRYVRNVIEKAIRTQAMRLLTANNYHKKELMTLRAEDLTFPT